ncbi:glycosyltransferase family 2 protein [Desulfosarcina sp. BuS5]|uniref:glycosyltransferase family 2 protein n=1 Tax=Desulfosarcina sp. BuS5 TaxID=933262 RepID=UPI001E62DF0F|nr:glycosyltransferase [Desulfosarcina sp. BuS5]
MVKKISCTIMQKPQISVIIPTYNRGWVLKEAVDSVLSQYCTDFELIVVDDGSTDNTTALLQGYKGRLKVLQQDNRGVSAARNLGIKNSFGQYIAFLDSDDLWRPEKLSFQLEFFASHKEALICQTEEIWIRNGIRVNPGKKHKKISGHIFEQSLSLCLVSPSAVMMDRRLFDETGMFDENLPACEDYDLWLRTSLQYPVFLLDKPLVIKRGGHDDQLSKAPGLDKYRVASILKLLQSDRLSNSRHKKAVKMLLKKCKIYGAGCAKRGRYDEAEHYQKLVKKYA